MTTAPPPSLLTTLADLLLESHADLDVPAIAVGIDAVEGDQVSLATKELSGHPATELLGVTAPPAWCGFGIVARGTARAWPRDHPSPDATTIPPPPAPGTRLRLVHLVGRDATVESRVVTDGGDLVVSGAGDVEGAIHDTCLRVLGLPTAPAPHGTLEYWARHWLVRVVAAGADAHDSWADVVAHHPVASLLDELDPAIGVELRDHLVKGGRALARARTWPDLRRRVAASSDPWEGLLPEDAAWMDDGIFARWCLGLVPPLDELVDAVEALLPPALATRVGATLQAWDLADLDTRARPA